MEDWKSNILQCSFKWNWTWLVVVVCSNIFKMQQTRVIFICRFRTFAQIQKCHYCSAQLNIWNLLMNERLNMQGLGGVPGTWEFQYFGAVQLVMCRATGGWVGFDLGVLTCIIVHREKKKVCTHSQSSVSALHLFTCSLLSQCLFPCLPKDSQMPY